jgi:hypothetical protein
VKENLLKTNFTVFKEKREDFPRGKSALKMLIKRLSHKFSNVHLHPPELSGKFFKVCVERKEGRRLWKRLQRLQNLNQFFRNKI